MTNRHTGASAGGRHNGAPVLKVAGKRVAGKSFTAVGLACLLFATAPALAAAPALDAASGAFTAQAARAVAPAATTALAMNGAAGSQAFTTVLPREAENCPQAAGHAAPPATAPAPGAAAGAKDSPCLGRLTDRLLDMAARKAGQFLPMPVLVF